MSNTMDIKDANQVIRSSARQLEDGGVVLGVQNLSGSLVPEEYDQISLTYVAAGNGVGEIETATYKLDGNTIATLTLSYDAQDRLIDVVRS
jgi:hypothetical protein